MGVEGSRKELIDWRGPIFIFPHLTSASYTCAATSYSLDISSLCLRTCAHHHPFVQMDSLELPSASAEQSLYHDHHF
jgi:hypothetical protein